MHLPGFNNPTKWDKETSQMFKDSGLHTYDEDPENNYAHFSLYGTTFSGQSFRTTFGNTLRQMCYIYYYLGFYVEEPWNCDDIKIFVSGDDCVVFTSEELAEGCRDIILMMTTRGRDVSLEHILGQCIKTVELNPWYIFDFCSLLTFSSTGRTDDLHLTANIYKQLATKNYFYGKNKSIIANPVTHRF